MPLNAPIHDIVVSRTEIQILNTYVHMFTRTYCTKVDIRRDMILNQNAFMRLKRNVCKVFVQFVVKLITAEFSANKSFQSPFIASIFVGDGQFFL